MSCDQTTFFKDRLEAFKSLDRQRIKEFAGKYGIKQPRDEGEFWRMVHKTRVVMDGFTDEEKQISRDYLLEVLQ